MNEKKNNIKGIQMSSTFATSVTSRSTTVAIKNAVVVVTVTIVKVV